MSSTIAIGKAAVPVRVSSRFQVEKTMVWNDFHTD